MMKNELKLLLISLLFFSASCQEYLDVKPDKKLAILNSVTDAQTLLNNSRTFNFGHPSVTTMAADELYVQYDDWAASFTLTELNSYIWERNVFNENDRNDWSLRYVSIYHSNVVLDAIDNNEIAYNDINELNDIEGQALFYRAYNFYSLLQVFAKPWSDNTKEDLGIPLRLTSDLNIPSTRATVDESYKQVISDAERALSLLNNTSEIATRPNKTVVLAFLARVYLSMEKYEEALDYADQVLGQKDDLLSFNEIDGSRTNPFDLFNREVIFHSGMATPLMLYPHIARVDSTLYSLYENGDLRRVLYFQDNADESKAFRGSYNGSPVLFNGLTTAEMYYIKAECLIRLGDWENGLSSLRDLLVTRWVVDNGQTTYVIPDVSGADAALSYVLKERRKGLIFRGLRWSDLRRLNKDVRFGKDIERILNGDVYTLTSGDSRYVFPIPLVVIEMTGMEQNE